MTMTLTETENRMAKADADREAAARARFVAAAWAGKPAEELVNLAHTVGLPTADADKLLARIEAARQDARAADAAAGALKQAVKLEAVAAGIAERESAIIEAAEAKIRASADTAAAARQRANEAEQAAYRVLVAVDAGIVPADAPLPDYCREIQRIRQAEADQREAERRWQNAREQVTRLRRQVADLAGADGEPARVEGAAQRQAERNAVAGEELASPHNVTMLQYSMPLESASGYAVVDAWLHSEAHAAEMLNPRYTLYASAVTVGHGKVWVALQLAEL